jgi:hypothetical protein
MDFSGATANQKGYLYDYNRNNWLTGAVYGTTDAVTATISPNSAFDYREKNITYDPNGNIKTLVRNSDQGCIDNLTYFYGNTGKNRLSHVDDTTAADASTVDIDDQATRSREYDIIFIGWIARNCIPCLQSGTNKNKPKKAVSIKRYCFFLCH